MPGHRFHRSAEQDDLVVQSIQTSQSNIEILLKSVHLSGISCLEAWDLSFFATKALKNHSARPRFSVDRYGLPLACFS